MLTIAIPTYKRSKYLAFAIKSALNQKNVSIDYKVMVVNNDPETDMSELKQEFGDKVTFYTNEKNLGMLGNMNRCIDLVETKYIAFLHDDDMLLPNYISVIEKYLLLNVANCIIPKRYLFNEKGEYSFKKKIKSSVSRLNDAFSIKKISSIKVIDNVYCWQNCYNAPTCGIVFNTNVLKENGKFTFEHTLAWDYLSMLKLNDKEDVILLKDTVAVYRVSSGLTNKPTTQIDFFNSYESLLDVFSKYSSTKRFVKFFHNEIKYLNYNSISEDAKKLLNYDLPNHYSKSKYLLFMIYRFMYLFVRGINVEMIPTNKELAMIKNMEQEGK